MDVELGIPSYPFFTGSLSGTSTPPSGGSGGGGGSSGDVTRTVPNTITLDGWTYAIDTKQYRFSSQSTLRDTAVSTDQPNDTLFNADGAWSRYQFSWHLGSDQELQDLDADASSFRFDTSRGVDPWTQYQLELLPSVVEEQSLAANAPLLIRSGDYVYCADGADLYRTTDLETWTAMTDPGGTIQALATDGTDLYVATSTLMGRYVGAGTSITLFGTPVTGNCTNVAFVANRLLVAVANVISEVGATGTLTALETHYQAAFRWTTIFNLGSRIYIGGHAGSRSELYTVVTDSSGTLVKGQEAAPLPDGELLRGAVAYGGSVMLLTSNGVRFAQIGADGTLTYGPLLDDMGDVRCGATDGRFAYVGWSAFQDSGAGVARLALDRFVDVLQPAYASDVHTNTASDSITGVARLGGRTAFAKSADGVYVSSTTGWVQTGYVMSGQIYFGTVEPKTLVELEVVFDPLDSGESVEVEVRNEFGELVGSGSQAVLNATSLTVDLDGEQTTWCTVKITLNGDGTSTPTVKRWRMRAYPVPPPVMQWLVPIIAHQTVQVNDAEGQHMSQDPLTIRDRIVELWSTKTLCIYREGSRAYRVRVDGFELQPARWTDDGQFFQGLLMVRLVNTY